MKQLFTNKAAVILRAILIYIWLTVLSPLSVTDTYYSVYLLCGVMGLLCLYDNYKSGCTGPAEHKWVLWICSAWFSLAVTMANFAMFEPLSVLQNLFDVLCCFAGGLCVGNAVLTCMLNRLPLTTECGQRNHAGRVFLLVFVSIAAIDLLYLFFGVYPGILTTDSVTTIRQLMGDEAYNNTMPFWHTLTVQPFVKLGLALFGNWNAAVACFHVMQILFMAGCFAYVIMTLYQIGAPVWFLTAVYCAYAIQPHNIVYSVTLWKDIPFAGATALFITSLYRLLKEVGNKRGNYAVFLLGALGFSLWRTNGWYAFLVTGIVMFFLLRKKNKRLLMLMTAILVFCWILLNPVLSILGVGETNLVEAYAIPMQQVARVITEGRELTSEETWLLGEIFWLDKVPQLYDPLTVDPIKFETFRYDQVEHIRANAGEYLGLYLSLGLKYPGDYLKAWIEETKGYWNGGYFFWIYTLQMGSNPYGIETAVEPNLIGRLFAAAFRYLEKPAFLQILTSIGIHVWALVSCTLVNILKKKEEFLLSIPLLVLIFGLWLGTPVYSEFRYAYPMFVSMPLILAVTLFAPDTPKT